MTPQERAAAIAAQARAREARDKARNRELMPVTAGHLDEITAMFGKLPAGKVWEGDQVREWGKVWWNR